MAMKNSMRCPATPPLHRQLSEWYGRPLGEQLGKAESEALDAILPNLFGYHLLQVGCAGNELFSSSRILHKVAMVKDADSGQLQTQLAGDPEQMPIQTDSVDAVILYHTLEFARDPHQVLREAERILVPEGHMVIISFNPFSLWGLRRLFSLRCRHVPWCGRFLGGFRLKDWLALLGFELTLSRSIFFRPPLRRQGIMSRLERMEHWGARWCPFLGGVQILVGRKKVSTLTPIKPRWRPQRSLNPGLVDTASSRSYKHCCHQNTGSKGQVSSHHG